LTAQQGRKRKGKAGTVGQVVPYRACKSEEGKKNPDLVGPGPGERSKIMGENGKTKCGKSQERAQRSTAREMGAQ